MDTGMKEEIEDVKTDLERAASLIESVRQRLNKFGGEITPSEVLEPPEWNKQRLELWVRLYDSGGVVDQTTLHKFAKEVGYDPRGLAGFFKGKGSLVWVGKTGEGKVALSTWASEEVERYRDWLDQQKKKQQKK